MLILYQEIGSKMSKKDLSFYNIKANEIFKKEEEKPKEELKEEPKKAKVGRPFLEDKKLSKQVAVYLNASEYRSLKARTRGGSVSSFVKDLIRKELENK